MTNPPDPSAKPDTRAAQARLSWAVGLTRWGMGAEALSRAFWPLWVVLGLAFACLAFGLPGALPQWGVWTGAGAVIILALATLGYGLWHLRLPKRAEAEARVDRATPGRPIQTLSDTMAIGADDPAAKAVWQAHLSRVAQAAKAARPVAPNLQLSRFDGYGLRLIAATAVAMAVVFGSGWRSDVSLIPGIGGQALATGPSWEGWADPPSYTGLPSLYLNELSAKFTVPQGSLLTLRLYGADGSLSVSETVSGPTPTQANTDPVQEHVVAQSGSLAVDGPSGQQWDVAMAVDMAPRIQVDGPLTRVGAGEMRLPFSASDDFAVIAGRAKFALDMGALDRRHGLATAPDPRPTLEIPIPLTVTGNRARFSEVLAEDFSKHPWANLPVSLVLQAEDDLSQTGQSAPFPMVLPGRRFFNPTAAALIEQRRDLLWSRDNALRVSQVLRAISYLPDGFMTNEDAFLTLSTATARLIGAVDAPLTPDLQAEVAETLWEAALLFEEGSLQDAKERLERAQEALKEAMRRGASEDEIARLMQELQEAMDNYLRQRAEEARNNPDQQQEQDPDAQQMDSDQLQELLDEIQRLMNEGKMDEAQALLEQLMEMLENMTVSEGQGQDGQSPGEQAMDQLQDTLRDQQDLADESFQDMQENDQQGQQGQSGQQGQGGQQGLQGQQGQPGQPQGQNPSGQPGETPGDIDGDTLAQRQQALEDMVQQQRRNLPGAGTPEGDAARDSLGRAARSMGDAAEALEQGEFNDALDSQSEAIDALRDTMQNLGELMANEVERNGATGQEGQRAEGEAPPNNSDPLGREAGNTGRLGTEDGLLADRNAQDRAQKLLDEIRRRSAEQGRPEAERDYLNRLLDRF